MTGLVSHPLGGTLAEALAAEPSEAPSLYWLGQAGFVIDIAGRRLVIDPYLSNTLAEKYPKGPFRYDRLMPPPATVDELGRVDAVLVTHGHTDHLDPGTLKPLLTRNPAALLVAPRAISAVAIERAASEQDRFLGANAGEPIELPGGIEIVPTRAAHETLKRESNGDHHFLGYIIRWRDTTLWHSGDCVPFDGLIEEVAAHRVELALLPVNGRREELSTAGVSGNFSLEEAIAVARACGCRAMIAHHYGMFAFNTAEASSIDVAAAASADLAVYRARPGEFYALGGPTSWTS